jgi:hypothetical protein
MGQWRERLGCCREVSRVVYSGCGWEVGVRRSLMNVYTAYSIRI